MNYRKKTILAILLLTFIPLQIFTEPKGIVNAATIDELQREIDARNQNIKNLEKEIAQIQGQVQEVGKQANTLTNTIKSLDLSKQKLQTDIGVTENKIGKTNLQIQQLAVDINRKENSIEENREIIGETLRKMYQQESESFVTTLLGRANLSSVWDSLDALARFQSGIKELIGRLQLDKRALASNKEQTEKSKKTLEELKNELGGQKSAVEQATKEKADLLAKTKSQEAAYKAILADKLAKKEQLEKEIFLYESQLKIAIDPNSLPTPAKGILSWPLEKVTITQYFGNTAFATQNPQIYNGSGHNAIDMGAPTGTKVMAAKEGIITATGNTDLIPGCWSLGKWVFIKHPNGLSTLYAHLSVISVSPGESVASGKVIGYSGNTGYSTGPHLHFGVYATQGVKITKFENSINCKGATIPLADPKAYLNPLSYL